MTARPARWFFCPTLLVLAVLTPASGQGVATQDRAAFDQGTHAFRRVLLDSGFQPVASVADLNLMDPEEAARTLIVMLGDTDPLDLIEDKAGGLKDFVSRGGALLVATDRQSAAVLDRNFGISVTGRRFALNRASEGYLGLADFPQVLPLEGEDPPLFQPLTFPGRPALPPVVANVPSYLDFTFRRPVELKILAVLPRVPLAELWNYRFPYLPLAAGGELGQGRVLIIADHSLFINGMMLREDTGNLDCALRCAHWLREGPQGKRTRILFWEDGSPRADFDVPLKELPPPPLPPLEALIPLVNQTLHGLEKENAFNEILLQAAGEGDANLGQRRIWQWLILILTLLGSAYLLLRLGWFRHQPEAGGGLDRQLEKQPGQGPLLEQRFQELLQQGNLWEAARGLARDLFAETGLPAGPAGSLQAAPCPGVMVQGNWWRRWWLGRRVRHLWVLAHGSLPVRVSRRRFAALTEEIQEVRQAMAAGTLRLVQGKPLQ